MNLDRPLAQDPYAKLPTTAAFALRSDDIVDGEPLPRALVAPGRSPQLAWSGAPETTRGFAVSCFDPDAPTPAGYWHWTLVNLPATVTVLPPGMPSDVFLADGAVQLRNDGGTIGFAGAAPPAGDRPHRYYFAVHALDVPALDVSPETTPTAAAFQMLFHTVGRAVLIGTHQQSS